jgi:C4-dicarboxylate transporter DctM subunit
MDWLYQSLLILAVLMGGLLIGLPIAFSIGVASLAGIVMFQNPNAISALANIAWASSNNFTLTAVPLFLFMSEIIMYTGIGKDMFKTMEKWFGRLPGGLAVGGSVSSAIFGAISGNAMAIAAIVGGTAIPEMRKAGYSNKLACGSIAASSTLGFLIPPSLPMITYGVITETSVGNLFIAGIIPGIVLCLLFCIYIVFSSRKEKNVTFVKYSFAEKMASLIKILPVIILIILVIGSIYGGIATPTEAAGLGAVGSVIIAACMRRLKGKDLFQAARNSVRTCAMIIIIILNAQVFAYLLTSLRLPMLLSQVILDAGLSKWVVFILIQAAYIFLGMFFDAGSIFLLTMPILFPIITSLGFDPVWFCIACICNLCVAVITPPVGLVTYVVKGLVPDVTITEILKGAMPFLVIDMIMVLLLCFFPWMTSILL